ncbi:hypothetical protein [Pacificibacter marinus]|uniref:Uncharacterized protein n=1 Tax=Pacificibacter marinus TaxID=658057 RepID=A0A1Y5SXD4_9RHOB|nr:hypothetical protein [Pacificibacter marinus]SEK65755.1 hypothetical protein SAMN04488032_1054 [Pacificibacter marinus]SLN47258.1 hypothetical protein PAM7971_02321 [Pacificibacter marinus]
MDKKTEDSKTKFCKTKRLLTKPTAIVTHFFDTVWAAGVSVAAAMAFSTSIHWRKALCAPYAP